MATQVITQGLGTGCQILTATSCDDGVYVKGGRVFAHDQPTADDPLTPYQKGTPNYL